MPNLVVSSPGYFWGYSVYHRASIGNGPMANPGANKVQVAEFVIPFDITVAAVTTVVAIAQTGTHINIGLYNSTGNKVLDSGQINSAATGNQGVTGLSTFISSGAYYLAWSCDDTTNTVFSPVMQSNDSQQNKTQVRWGVATNLTSGGVMPATLGAIVSATQSNAPLILFEAA